MIPIALLDVDCNLDRAWLNDLAEMLTVVSQRDFAKPEPHGYGVGAIVRVAQNSGDIAPGEWVMAFISHPDVAGALGYHDVTPSGQPLAKCFPFLDDESMRSVTASHELFEMLANAGLNTSVVGPDSVVRAREPGDPVEALSYPFKCSSGRTLNVTDWVTPAYFSPPSDNSAPYDAMGQVTQPGQILPGGYQILWDATQHSWTQQTNGEKRAYRQRMDLLGTTRMVKRNACGLVPPGHPQVFTNIIDVARGEKPANIANAAKQGLGAVWAKASQGKDWTDPTFTLFMQEAKDARVLRGAYHFASGSSDGRQQADWFLSHIGPGMGDVLLALDWEHNPDTANGDMTLEDAEAFVSRIHELTGRWPVLYSGLDFLLTHHIPTTSVLRNCPLWLACYGPEPMHVPAPWTVWDLWQYTDWKSGPNDKVTYPRDTPGLGVRVDRSAFRGDLAGLRTWWSACGCASASTNTP